MGVPPTLSVRVPGCLLNWAKAYPLAQLRKQPGVLKDSIGEVPIQIEVNAEGEVVDVRNQQGRPIPHIFAYWFAWQAFHPETTVYHSKK